MRETMKKCLQRGKVECFLQVDLQAGEQQQISVNLPYLRALLDANGEIYTQMQVATEEKASTFLGWPGVVNAGGSLPDDCEDQMLSLFVDTLDQLVSHRQREGIELVKFIGLRLVSIEQLIDDLSKQLPEMIVQQQAKVTAKIEQLQVAIDQDRLMQELVFLAQKADVSEELDRVSAHLKEISIVIKQGEPCGRRLDFLMQELNREANTLGSKSINIATSQASIELKVLVEQVREQVQNIE